MPCRNDWDPPTKAQAENRRAAKMLIALNNIQGKTSSTQLLVDSTNPVLDTDYVQVLCERLTFMDRSDRESLLYGDAHDRHARDLATWWEEHQARDEVRMRTSPTLNLLGVCSEAMREAGKPYPRTCLVCGLGPCQRGRQLMVGVDLAGGPDMTAISVAPRLQSGQQEYLVPVPRESQQAEPPDWRNTLRVDLPSSDDIALAYKRGFDDALAGCIRGGEAWARSMFANNGEHIKPQQAAPVEWPVGHSWARKMAALEAAEESDPTTPIIAPQQAEPVAWGQLGMMNGRAYLRQKYDREPYPPPPDVARNLMLVPLYLHPPAAEVQRLRDAAGVVMKQWAAKDDLALAIAMNELRRALEGGE